MQTVTVEHLITLLVPVCSGIICLVLVLLRFPVWDMQKGTGMRQSLVSYYMLTALNWSLLILLSFFPREFAYIRPLYIYMVLLVPIALYRFIFVLTRTDSRERFSGLHYILPAVIFLTYLIWSWSVPREVMLQTSYYNTESIPEYRGYYIFVAWVAPMRLLFGLAYSILSLLRYRRYRRMIVNYSSDLHHSSLYWLRIFLILWFSFLILPVFGIVTSAKTLLTELQLLIPAILLFVQHVLLAFHAIRGNYVFVTDNGGLSSESADGFNEDTKPLKQPTFDRYIDRKPFTDPNLTIVDMAAALHTNRAYLSGFINKVYGMNFAQFVNECRLQELDRIIADPHSAGKSNMEKITEAGFGSHQSYRRALKMQEKRKLLKIDE